MSGGGKQSGGAALSRDAANGSEALRRLKSGESSLDEYLDYRADRAVDHLSGVLDAERLVIVRDTIREQLATDPVLAELISFAAGSPGAPSAGR